MAFVAEPSAEPIPGYRLLERLGTGGFGDVWKAQAPGGLLKAIKIVHGDVGTLDADGSHRAEQELRALRRIQSIRHPYILSIERYDIIDSRLMIVTELADCNLYDRFDEYKKKNQPGIPRAELLRYLREAAEALDLMNGQHNLQHLDIKPQNLFLIHDHVKVADFGLVKDLESVRSDTSAAVTPLYAAPETFESRITPFCDQYSLAVVYQELLTGHRPFGGTTIQQLAMQHLQAPPNLTTLPHADRPAVAKALAKKPENRHPSCMALIDALLAGSAEPPQPKIAARMSDAPKEKARGLPNVNESMRRLEKKVAKPFRPETPPTQMRVRKTDVVPVVIDEPARRTAPPEVIRDGVLFPALVVGLGRTGLAALKRLRKSLCERFGGMSSLPHLKLLYIDCDPETADTATRGTAGAALETDEILLTRLNRASHYLKPRRNGRTLMEGWFDAQWLYRIPRNPAVNGQRALGRLAFGDWYQSITERFVDLLEEATDPDSLQRAEKNTSLGLRTNRPRAYVIANLGGGTGGGAFIDVAYALRNRLKTLGYESPHVAGLFTLPIVERQSPAQLSATANTFAALTELTHYCHPDSIYQCTFDDRDASWTDTQPPFSCAAILQSSDSDQYAVSIADFLCRNLTQEFGRAIDAERIKVLKIARPTTEACVATFGVTSLISPRQELVRAASRRVCELVIDRWARRDPNAIRPGIAAWVTQQLKAENLGPNMAVDRLKCTAEPVIGELPEVVFSRLAQRLAPKGWFGGGLDTDAARDLISRWQELLGQPEATDAETKVGLIGVAMASAATTIGKEWGSKLAQMAVTLIEQPEYRMTGAEVAIAQIREQLDAARTGYLKESQKLAAKSVESLARAHWLVSAPTGRKVAAEFFEIASSYPQTRHAALCHHYAAQMCDTLSQDLGEQLGEVRFCRQRLEEFLAGIRSEPEAVSESTHYLLPNACATMADAVTRIVQSITENDFAELDRRMQKMLQTQFMALVHVCLSTSDMFADLEPAMMKLATQFVSGRVGNANAAAVFFEQHGKPQSASAAAVKAFDDAAPILGDNVGLMVGEIVAISVPPDEAGTRFTKLTKDAIGHDEMISTIGHDDIAIYRELPRVPLAKLPQFGPQARECFDYIADHDRTPPHTRNDVEEWLA
jgi:serine/threonine protein kinase